MAEGDLGKPAVDLREDEGVWWITFNRPEAAERIEAAVKQVLRKGLRTADIRGAGTRKVGTREMGDAIAAVV